jgi:MFS transporter, FLVCR family, MFS-domain-containing protein 7
LRAGLDAKPPLNMRNALIFNSTIICVVSVLIFGLKGKQNRRERDEIEAGRARIPTAVESSLPSGAEEPKESKDA